MTFEALVNKITTPLTITLLLSIASIFVLAFADLKGDPVTGLVAVYIYRFAVYALGFSISFSLIAVGFRLFMGWEALGRGMRFGLIVSYVSVLVTISGSVGGYIYKESLGAEGWIEAIEMSPLPGNANAWLAALAALVGVVAEFALVGLQISMATADRARGSQKDEERSGEPEEGSVEAEVLYALREACDASPATNGWVPPSTVASLSGMNPDMVTATLLRMSDESRNVSLKVEEGKFFFRSSSVS